MAIKPNGKLCVIKEQIIEDPVSELTLQFRVYDTGSVQLTIYGNLPFGNRDFIFDSNGELSGSGTGLAGPCKASWLREVDKKKM